MFLNFSEVSEKFKSPRVLLSELQKKSQASNLALRVSEILMSISIMISKLQKSKSLKIMLPGLQKNSRASESCF